MKITIELLDAQGQVKSGAISSDQDPIDYRQSGENLVAFGTKAMTWEAGDQIKVTTEKPQQYLWVQLDETLAPSLVYLAGTQWTYQMPFAEKLIPSQLDTSFHSTRHYLAVRLAQPFEVNRYQNLALNTHDQYHETGLYPHAKANVETRGESVFFAKNAIDGKLANLAHGSYPFQSWGINQQADAALTVEFGRTVAVDRVDLLFRGDYPHDSYWTQVTLAFSDGSTLKLDTAKDLNLQTFKFASRQVQWVQLKDLQKAGDDSPFPALTQIEVYGYNL
ncbi:hypothetical protein FC83_GL001987 [Agrilactobacillus composti DSM 18527 = JCM 14202]|jgi:hypothetical protein|uniref:Carbohydrate-binding protein n=1 Tax=Agrilactobacillus composti DSM 18527 = JCM 14202 TaxID=1423734 RepID=X0QJC2_9LACO|nr:hypothetical protein [Agrilactobacillus composti]KRM34850.1 hypothetical protein FC83_GL001987 [Agrilactobacillus composti DSM 18527 = JCM 14202]MCH4169914.1 hypothetical protein [Lactobacillus sp.]GAF38710.1 hypothetical protein JCM14202_535 [Agrilactobacillus composti DSM 18527 = JCM 14202]